MVRRLLSAERATQSLQSGAANKSAVTVARSRQRRSREYMDALRKLDSGGHLADDELLREIRDAMAAEFPAGPSSWPLGIVAKCYLGVPFEVHTVDISGQIIRHYKIGEPLPGEMERARRLAASEAYMVIELYTDRLVAIAADGSTSVSNF